MYVWWRRQSIKLAADKSLKEKQFERIQNI